MINSIKERIEIICNKTFLLLRTVASNKWIITLLILFPIMTMVIPIIFIPFWAAGPFMLQLNIITTTGLLYGSIVFGYKKSTLNSNEMLITKSRSVSYLSALIVILLFVFISSSLQLVLIALCNWIGILLPDWLTMPGTTKRGLSISNLPLFAWYWCIFWITIITFGIFFVLRNAINGERSHYGLVFGIIVFSFIWGGTLNDYFGGNVFVESDGSYERSFSRGMFPDYMYWPTAILFPYFGVGQFSAVISDFTITDYGNTPIWIENFHKPIIHLSFASDYEFHNKWNILIISPIMWSAILTMIGVLQSTK